MNFLGIIPARYASTRLAGKPLADIAGKTMIQWVYEAASKALNTVYVATDDKRIADVVAAFGGKFVMTKAEHVNGTSRCLEAFDHIKGIESLRFDAVINVQGDEPLLHPESLEMLKSCFADGEVDFATLVKPITSTEDLFSDSDVFVTLNKFNEAMYFSRSVIPFVRGQQKEDWLAHGTFYKHLGLYAYTYEALSTFAALPPSPLEMLENLEQLRWLENGGKIRAAITPHDSYSVDTETDLLRVREIMAQQQVKSTSSK